MNASKSSDERLALRFWNMRTVETITKERKKCPSHATDHLRLLSLSGEVLISLTVVFSVCSRKYHLPIGKAANDNMTRIDLCLFSCRLKKLDLWSIRASGEDVPKLLQSTPYLEDRCHFPRFFPGTTASFQRPEQPERDSGSVLQLL